MCALAGRLQRQVDVLDQSSLIPCIQDPCGCVVFKFHRRTTSRTSKGRNVVVNPKRLGHVPFLREKHGNEMIGDGGVTEFIKSLDFTLFQYNMRGGFDMQKHIRTHAESFQLFKMNSSGDRGFMMLCKNCTRVCKISWS